MRVHGVIYRSGFFNLSGSDVLPRGTSCHPEVLRHTSTTTYGYVVPPRKSGLPPLDYGVIHQLSLQHTAPFIYLFIHP